ncbi:MAG TPA: hypothetical protein VMA36_03485 [Candidatus Limnocylindria bacterium]|nr:hypothetical protein [Candidatus Limnocylindria bacterium]
MSSDLVVALDAVIVAVSDEEPRVLLRSPDEALPAGPFDPHADRTLEVGLRRWVTEQTRLELGHVEQLYTFGDRDRDPRRTGGPRMLSIAYLAFVHERPPAGSDQAHWHPWYDSFPWEDWREGRPALVDDVILPAVDAWVCAGSGNERRERERRARRCTGTRRTAWNPELVLERYELFWEIGLVAEARTPGPRTIGTPMALDHRRILATAIGRIRGALRYRPLVFELLAPQFTLLHLQRTVEALAGVRLHKGNFRRLVTAANLVEPTGERERDTNGRPAERYRFRADVVAERDILGLSITPSG